MRIDVHAHYWTEDYLDLLTDLGKADAGAARGLGAGGGAELAARLRLMDRAGVQMQVLSACPQTPYGEDGKKAAGAARRSTRAAPGPSSTRTPAPCSASDKNTREPQRSSPGVGENETPPAPARVRRHDQALSIVREFAEDGNDLRVPATQPRSGGRPGQ